MCGNHKFQPGAFILSLAISLGVGAVSGFATKNSMQIYKEIRLPPLSPPSWVFPVVWTVLFILMGIAAYLVFTSDAPQHEKSSAFVLYAVQLAVNFIWPILFFNLEAYFFAFLWLCLLIVLVVATIGAFRRVCGTAAWLMLPYLLWVLFAGYLNAGVFMLN